MTNKAATGPAGPGTPSTRVDPTDDDDSMAAERVVIHIERRPGKVRCDRHDLRCDEPGHGEREQERIRTAPRRKHARGLSADENEEHGKHERRAHAS